jgi:hypothetical protein
MHLILPIWFDVRWFSLSRNDGKPVVVNRVRRPIKLIAAANPPKSAGKNIRELTPEMTNWDKLTKI